MQAVSRMMPGEECQAYSAMTSQSLYYMGERDLANKILAIAEEEGAESASYALKLLQSEGSLSIASMGKDAITGELRTRMYRVRGPVMIFLTTTAIDTDPALLNRCLVLTVDEGPEQTAAIQARQREARTLAGLLARKQREKVLKLHQNAQRLLEPLLVVNDLAKGLRFTSKTTRARRDHAKLLTLIDAIALLHQHQRPTREVVEYGERIRFVEVTEKDVERAETLAAELLSANDELPPQTRRLLGLIDQMVAATVKRDGIEASLVRFTRKDVRCHTQWSDAALKKHLGRLVDLEHLVVHGGGGARQRRVYALATHRGVEDLVTPQGLWSPRGRPLVTPGGSPEKSSAQHGHADLVTPSAEERELGCDPTAFPTEHHFVSWLRLCTRRSISGGKPLKTQRNGLGANRINAALRMAALTLQRSKTALGAEFRRIARRKGAGIAVFVIARKLACLIYGMLRYGKDYTDLGEAAYEAKWELRRLAALSENARSLGFDLVKKEGVPA